MIAYPLFRIADTFEDAAHWERGSRIAALSEFRALLAAYSRPQAERLSGKWSAAGPSAHAGYRELIAEVPFVLNAFFALRPDAVEPVRAHVIRSAEGMARYVARTRGKAPVLSNLPDLKAYCYVVAGIVGEMLTELFLLGRPGLQAIAPFLRERASTFGEALQLTNILKDSATDASEGTFGPVCLEPRSSPWRGGTSRPRRPISPGSSPPPRRRAWSSSRPCRYFWHGRPSTSSRGGDRARRSAARRSFC
ncbi:MAG: squalene/phytoene synthase family protein [Thermoanaerobaculia bacterium]